MDNNGYPHQNQPTRSYSTDPAYTAPTYGRRDYEQLDQPPVRRGAPPAPAVLNTSGYAISVAIITAVAGGITWLVVHFTNQLPPDSTGYVVQRDVSATVVGVVLLTLVAAALLAFLISSDASRPGLMFGILAVATGAFLALGPRLVNGPQTWQVWVSTSLVNAVLVALIAGVLYAAGKGATATDRVQQF